jgi:hypothetical protein
MSTDDIGGPVDPFLLASRLDALGVNKGNHEPAPHGAIYVGDLHATAPTITEKSQVGDTYRIEFDYPVNTIVENPRDEHQARSWLSSAQARALPDWIEIRLIRVRGGKDKVLERYYRDHNSEAAAPSPERRVLNGDLDATPGDYWCKRCGRDEITAREKGCAQGPCPMEPKRPIVFLDDRALMLNDRCPPDSILVYDSTAGEMRFVRQSLFRRALEPFIPALLVGLAALALIGVLAIVRGPV